MTELDEATLVNRLRERFEHAKNRRRPMVQRWLFNYATVNTRPWAANRQSWKPAPMVPEIYPIISTRVAWIRETSPTFDVIPAADPFTPFYDFQTRLANDMKVILDSAWTQENYNPEFERSLWDVEVYGTGILRTLWDPNAAGGLGNATMTRVDPFLFYPDPDGHDMDSCNYFFEVQRITLGELERRFPGAVAKLTQSNGGVAGQEKQPDPSPSQLDTRDTAPVFDPLGKSGKDSAGNDTMPTWSTRGSYNWRVNPDQPVLVFFSWIKDTDELDDPLELSPADLADLRTEGDDDSEPNGWTRQEPRQYACWRCVVFVENTIILDEEAEDLWSHGQHPYDRVVAQDTGEFWGKSMVDLLAPSQLSVNRLLAAIEHNIWLMGNPMLLEDRRSGISKQTITNKPGQRLRINPGAQVSFMNPPTMQPQMAVDLLQFYINEMERISGITGMIRGASPTGRNAQSVLDTINEAAFVRVRLFIRNIETALQGVGDKAASLICEFYDTPRIVAIIGPAGEASALAIHGKHFYSPSEHGRVPMRFILNVQAGSTLPTSKSARMAELDQLFAMGAIDREALLSGHNLPNWQDIAKRMDQKEAVAGPQGPGARAAAGRTH